MSDTISVVFAGGGCRAFWALGVWEALRRDVPPVAEWAGVSAGSAMAIASAAQCPLAVVDGFCDRIATNPRNLYPRWMLQGRRPFPHEGIYRQTVRGALDDAMWGRLSAAGPVRILHAYVEPGRPIWRTVMGAMVAYQRRRRRGELHGPEQPYPGLGEEVVTAQQVERTRLVDHVLSSSASPPVTGTPRRNGRTYYDGSLVCNVPVRALSPEARAGRVLVLLSRPTPVPDMQGPWLYLAPRAPVPVKKWDYTRPDLVQRTWEQGLRDGARFRERIARWLHAPAT